MALLIREQVNGTLYEMAYYSYSYLPKQTAKSRARRQKLTTEAKQKINAMQSKLTLMRYIALNFRHRKDRKAEFTFRDHPDKREGARRRKEFHKRMRQIYAAQGEEHQYICVEETHNREGRDCKLHYHMILRSLPKTNMLRLLNRVWQEVHPGNGTVEVQYLIETDNFEDIASYFLKERKERGARRWTRSRNLRKPAEPVRHLEKESYLPEVPPGVIVWDTEIKGNDYGKFGYMIGRICNMEAFQTYFQKIQKRAIRGRRAMHPI
mgnify:CR=1 FL=1